MSGISDGIVTVKMAPPSLMFETETVPLCASTSPTIDSPVPRLACRRSFNAEEFVEEPGVKQEGSPVRCPIP